MLEHSVRVSDGTRIACGFHKNDKPVLILSNSLGTDHSMWEGQVGALTDHFSILTYDVRGHGGSDAPDGAYSIDRLALDVLDIMDAFSVDGADYCGVSLGGMVGQALAARSPERFRSMVLAMTSAYVGPPLFWQERIDRIRKGGMGAVECAVVGRWFRPSYIDRQSEVSLDLRRRLLSTNPIGYCGCCAAIRDMDLRPLASLNSLPTLVVVADEDEATPPAHGRFLAEVARNARLAHIPGAHLANVEEPAAFNAIVKEFWRLAV